MNAADVLELIGRLVELWPHQRDIDTPGARDQFVRLFAEIAPEHANAAVDAWLRDGEKWAPNAGQLLQKLADLALDVPEWGSVVATLLGRGAPDAAPALELPDACPHGERDCDDGLVLDWDTNTARPCSCRPLRQQIRRARRGRHPLVAEFLRHVGSIEVADLEDRTAQAQARQKWDGFVRELRREITYAGIDPAGLPQLERIAAAAGARAGELRSGEVRRPDFRLIQGGEHEHAAPIEEAR